MPIVSGASDLIDIAAEILCGRKRQTIRPHRKRHARPGEEMQLYTGMRTRNCRLIARVTCASVHEIEINFSAQRIVVDGIPVDDLAAFARADGFEEDDVQIVPHAAMRDFFGDHYGAAAPWRGVLLRWMPLNASGQTHTCSVCGKSDIWDERTWRWFGSCADRDEGRPVLKFCSKACVTRGLSLYPHTRFAKTGAT